MSYKGSIMFEHAMTMEALRRGLNHRMKMNGTPLQGWTWEDEVSHHNLKQNFKAVDILNDAINQRELLKLKKETENEASSN